MAARANDAERIGIGQSEGDFRWQWPKTVVNGQWLHFLRSQTVLSFVGMLVKIIEEPRRRLPAVKLDFDLAGAPDLRAILQDGTVRGKLPRTRRVEDGQPPPALCIAVGLADATLAIYVGLVIGQQHVFVPVEQRIDQRTE